MISLGRIFKNMNSEIEIEIGIFLLIVCLLSFFRQRKCEKVLDSSFESDAVSEVNLGCWTRRGRDVV